MSRLDCAPAHVCARLRMCLDTNVHMCAQFYMAHLCVSPLISAQPESTRTPQGLPHAGSAPQENTTR